MIRLYVCCSDGCLRYRFEDSDWSEDPFDEEDWVSSVLQIRFTLCSRCS